MIVEKFSSTHYTKQSRIGNVIIKEATDHLHTLPNKTLNFLQDNKSLGVH